MDLSSNLERQKFSFSSIKSMLSNSWRVFKIIWTERKGLVISLTLIIVLLSAVPFLVSGSRAHLLNKLIESITGSFTSEIILAVIFFLAALTLPPLLRSFDIYITKLFYFFLEARFEMLILRKKGELDVAVHEDPKHNDLFNRVRENGTWRIRNFTDRQFFVIENVLSIIFASSILFVAEWWVLLVIIVAALPELIIELVYGRSVWSIHMSRSERRRRYWSLHRHFQDTASIRELKVFQNIRYFADTIHDMFIAFQEEERKEEKKLLVKKVVSIFISQLAMGFASVWFVIQVVHGELQIGTLTFFLASIGDLRQALTGFFMNIGRQYQDNLFVTDVFTLLDLKPKLLKPDKFITLPHDVTPEIVFDRVTFRYPGTKNYVLKDFSLVIPAGEKLAIVGANGTGKTTFVKLLCRFYDPDKGRILIGGHNIKEIDLESFYNVLGVLFQDYNNYRFIVKESISVGRTDHNQSLEKIKHAARSSESDTFIEEWDLQYNQMLGKEFTEGVEPSIGQWQKLALARTFYRDPKILILDEPTASVDAEAEEKIFEKLEKISSQKTTILISHRFSTVRRANRICVIEKGTVKELGTHEELLSQNGTYARLFKLQARGYR